MPNYKIAQIVGLRGKDATTFPTIGLLDQAGKSIVSIEKGVRKAVVDATYLDTTLELKDMREESVSCFALCIETFNSSRYMMEKEIADLTEEQKEEMKGVFIIGIPESERVGRWVVTHAATTSSELLDLIKNIPDALPAMESFQNTEDKAIAIMTAQADRDAKIDALRAKNEAAKLLREKARLGNKSTIDAKAQGNAEQTPAPKTEEPVTT